MRRLEIRPVASRRLRAALLMVGLLAILALMQTRLEGWLLGLGVLLVFIIVGHGWYQSGQVNVPLALSLRPLQLSMQQPDGTYERCHCSALSVYTWLMVMNMSQPSAGVRTRSRWILLLPDSLPKSGVTPSSDDWRQILVWGRLMRRQISAGNNA